MSCPSSHTISILLLIVVIAVSGCSKAMFLVYLALEAHLTVREGIYCAKHFQPSKQSFYGQATYSWQA